MPAATTLDRSRPHSIAADRLNPLSVAERGEGSRREFKDYESYLRYYSNQRVDTEINLQLGDLTLKTARLEVLDPAIANMPDFIAVFGPQQNRTPMQSAEVKNTLYRSWVRLVGRQPRHPVLGARHAHAAADARSRLSGQRCPATSAGSSSRSRSSATAPHPGHPAVHAVNSTYPTSAAVAILSGFDPKTKTLKEIVVFRKPKVVHVYNIIEYGRRWYRSLCYSSDAKFTYMDMEPRLVLNQSAESGNQSSFGSVMQSSSYQPAVVPHFESGLIGYGWTPRPTVVISRSLTAALGTQVYVPPRLLYRSAALHTAGRLRVLAEREREPHRLP